MPVCLPRNTDDRQESETNGDRVRDSEDSNFIEFVRPSLHLKRVRSDGRNQTDHPVYSPVAGEPQPGIAPDTLMGNDTVCNRVRALSGPLEAMVGPHTDAGWRREKSRDSVQFVPLESSTGSQRLVRDNRAHPRSNQVFGLPDSRTKQGFIRQADVPAPRSNGEEYLVAFLRTQKALRTQFEDDMSGEEARQRRRERERREAMSEATGDANADVQQLLQVMQQQTEVMRQFQQRAETDRQAKEARRTTLIAASAATKAQGGIHGHEGGAPLALEESAFHALSKGFGMNEETADEAMRQGMSSTDTLKRFDSDKSKNAMTGMSKSKSPDCPRPENVFSGAAFEDKVTVLIEWIKFQKFIGAVATALKWSADPHADDNTTGRVSHLQEVKRSEGTDDMKSPAELKVLSNCRDWNDHLALCLRAKRGAAGVPLACAVRDEESAADMERAGTVGSASTDMCKNWDEHSIRCTVLSGAHYDSDNSSSWQMLSRLIREGPGWDHVRKFNKNGDGDGRAACMAPKRQVCQFANVRTLRQRACTAMENSRYDGDTRSWNHDKHSRLWKRNTAELRKWNDCPSEEKPVSDFCAQITDPRLDQPVNEVSKEGSACISDFDKMDMHFVGCPAVARRREETRQSKKGARNVLETRTDNRKRGRGKAAPVVHDGNCTNPEWAALTVEQKEQVRALRKAKKAKRSQQQRKVLFADTVPADQEKENKPENVKNNKGGKSGEQFGRKAHD